MSEPIYLQADQELKGIPAFLSEPLLGNQTVTGGGRNAPTGNCLFLLTPLHPLSLPCMQEASAARPESADTGGPGELSSMRAV